MNDMAQTIIPKSDQLNADDLIAGPLTIKIAGVSIRGGQEQPISISYEGDGGKPYKACKSMCRVMVTAWGADSKRYVGRTMTLYRDPAVKWGGMEVGGIRISHMSDIEKPLTMALTMTKQSRKPYTVKPLATPSEPAATALSAASGASSAPLAAGEGQFIDANQVANLEILCADNGISLDRLRKAAKVERLGQIAADRYSAALEWIDKAVAKGAA